MIHCIACNGQSFQRLGTLGSTVWYRCSACGWSQQGPNVDACDWCNTEDDDLQAIANNRDCCFDNVCGICLDEAEASAAPDYTGIPLY